MGNAVQDPRHGVDPVAARASAYDRIGRTASGAETRQEPGVRAAIRRARPTGAASSRRARIADRQRRTGALPARSPHRASAEGASTVRGLAHRAGTDFPAAANLEQWVNALAVTARTHGAAPVKAWAAGVPIPAAGAAVRAQRRVMTDEGHSPLNATTSRDSPTHGANRAARPCGYAPGDASPARDGPSGAVDDAARIRIEALLAVTRSYFEAPLRAERRPASADGTDEPRSRAR
jgi:hypothetical protein